MPALDLTGQKYGRLSVVGPGEPRGKVRRWICACDCGGQALAATTDLRTGNTQSCGCYMRQRQSEGRYIHGGTGKRQARTLVYRVWTQMKQRCHNPNDTSYYKYGARGITVCERWRQSFEAFRDDMGPRPDGYSIERKDNDGPYAPDNCVWASRHEQMRNRRVSVRVEFDGRTICASDYAQIMGVSSKRLYKVMSTRGLSAEDAAAFVKEREGKRGRIDMQQWLAARRAA